MHNEVRHDLTQADAKALATTIRRDIIRPLVEYNFGYDADIPFFAFDSREAEDLQSIVEVYEKLHQMGLKIPASHVYKKFNIPKPEDGEEILKSAVPGQAMPVMPEEDTGQSEQEQIDQMAGEAEKQTEALFQEMMNPILSLIDKADNLNELQTALKDEKELKKLYGQMDSPDLEDVIQQAIYLSTLIGRSMK